MEEAYPMIITHIGYTSLNGHGQRKHKLSSSTVLRICTSQHDNNIVVCL